MFGKNSYAYNLALSDSTINRTTPNYFMFIIWFVGTYLIEIVLNPYICLELTVQIRVNFNSWIVNDVLFY